LEGKTILCRKLINARTKLRLQQNTASIKAWLSANTAVTTSYGDTQTNLHFAAWRCDREVVEMCILQGKDVTVPDSCGWTALHLAVWNMHTNMVIFLLEVVDLRSWVSV
jgi:hypothetical protein